MHILKYFFDVKKDKLLLDVFFLSEIWDGDRFKLTIFIGLHYWTSVLAPNIHSNERYSKLWTEDNKSLSHKIPLNKLYRKWWGLRRRALGALNTPAPSPLLSAFLFLRIRKRFLMKLLYCFWNKFTWFSSINGCSNGINRSKNIKPFEFCVKELYCECHEIAKNLGLW